MQGLDNPFEAARYHSLVIEKDSCPDDLEVTAWTEDGIIMGVQHKEHAHIQACCSDTCSECTMCIELLLPAEVRRCNASGFYLMERAMCLT